MTVPAQAVVVPAAETSLTEGQFLGRLELFNEDGSPWTPPSGAVSWADITDKPTTFPPEDGSVTAPKLSTELAHLGDIPAPPATGTYVLTSTDGVLSWVAQA